jgi:hypothetical protein
MKASLRAARFRELAAECSSLAATAPMPQIRDQYRAMARHYLMLAETHGRKAHPTLQRGRLKGRSSSLEGSPP